MTGYIVTVTREDDLWVARAARSDGTDLGVLDFDSFTDMHTTMPEYLADMVDAGLSQRMADVLDLSHQRVNQLIHS